jgi:hypothetical protein
LFDIHLDNFSPQRYAIFRNFALMKRTTIILAILATGCARPAYVARSDAQTAYLAGHVAQIRESVFTNPEDPAAAPDTLGMTLDTHTVIDYNASGNITRMESFAGAARNPVASEEYTYDPSGARLEHSVERNPVKHTYSTLDYEHDHHGRLTFQGNRAWGPARTEYGYNRHGYLKTETEYSQTDSLTQKLRFRYDRFGRLRASRSVKGGDPARRYDYHPDGVVARVRTGKHNVDTYNERGHLVSTTIHVIQKKWGKNGKLRTTGRYPVTITAEYEYDARGNWVRRVQYFKDEVQSVAIREIDYYENR